METPIASQSANLTINAATIHFERYGSGGKPVLVICNGMNQTTASWHRYLQFLLPTHDVLLWEYGLVGDGHDRYMQFVDQLEGVIKTAVDKQEELHLMAVCYGGGVAHEYALRHPLRIKSLIYSGVMLTPEIPGIERIQAFRKIYDGGMKQALVDIFFSSMLGTNLLLEFRTMPAEIYNNTVAKMSASFTSAFPILARLQTEYLLELRTAAHRPIVNIPTLLIIGEEDQITTQAQQLKIVSLYAKIQVDHYPNVGHLTYMEATKQFFDRVCSHTTAGQNKWELK